MTNGIGARSLTVDSKKYKTRQTEIKKAVNVLNNQTEYKTILKM